MRNVIKIGAAARLVGRAEVTLRRWDEAELFAPRRDRNGHRIYTQADVEDLRVLKEMIKPGRPRKAEREPA